MIFFYEITVVIWCAMTAFHLSGLVIGCWNAVQNEPDSMTRFIACLFVCWLTVTLIFAILGLSFVRIATEY